MALPVPITAIYASLLGLFIFALAIRVVRLRRAHHIGIGDGGNKDLLRAIRIHGNAIENVPVALLLLLVYELNHGSPQLLHAFGSLLFFARVMHAWGLSGSAGMSIGRLGGVVGTWLTIVGLGVVNLLKLF